MSDVDYLNLEQGSDEWRKARAGLVTGTGCSVLESLHPYQTPAQWVREQVRALAGVDSEVIVNDAMKHGTDTEPEIVSWYEREFLNGMKVRQPGLVKHRKERFLAASPDGLVGMSGGIECKAPFYAKNAYSVYDTTKIMYLWQCHHVMEICDLEWIDFICYLKGRGDPVVSVERLYRKEDWLDELVDGRLFPKPRKGKHPRKTLYQAWWNYVMDEFQDPERCQRHLDPLQADAQLVTDDEDLNQLDMLRGREERILTEVGPQLEELEEVKKQQAVLKNVIADRYEGTVTNGATVVKVVTKQPPIDWRRVSEFLGGEQAVLDHGGVIEEFRRKTNTRQVSIKVQGDMI